MHKSQRTRELGLTLIELMMVVLLLAILAAIAIPNFIDFRKDAKNGATYSALGVIRSSLAIAVANIELKEDPESTVIKFPTLVEMQSNTFSDSHPMLKGTPILDPKAGVPKNPWTLPTLPAEEQNKIFDCGSTKTSISSQLNQDQRGWCYSESTGEVWANSNQNGAEPGRTENFY